MPPLRTLYGPGFHRVRWYTTRTAAELAQADSPGATLRQVSPALWRVDDWPR